MCVCVYELKVFTIGTHNKHSQFTIKKRNQANQSWKQKFYIHFIIHTHHFIGTIYQIPNTHIHIVFSWKSNLLFFYFPFDSPNSRTTMIMMMRIFCCCCPEKLFLIEIYKSVVCLFVWIS